MTFREVRQEQHATGVRREPLHTYAEEPAGAAWVREAHRLLITGKKLGTALGALREHHSILVTA